MPLKNMNTFRHVPDQRIVLAILRQGHGVKAKFKGSAELQFGIESPGDQLCAETNTQNRPLKLVKGSNERNKTWKIGTPIIIKNVHFAAHDNHAIIALRTIR